MKTYKYLVIFLVSFMSINLYSQDDNRFQNRNSVHLELGGSGLLYSLNYERVIINTNSFKTTGQIGFSYSPLFWNDLFLPIIVNEQFSFINHHIELGIGFVAIREIVRDRQDDFAIIDKIWTDALTGRIGYRYQKPDGRFVWRIGFTPLLQRERSGMYYVPSAPFKVFSPWGGISIGYSW